MIRIRRHKILNFCICLLTAFFFLSNPALSYLPHGSKASAAELPSEQPTSPIEVAAQSKVPQTKVIDQLSRKENYAVDFSDSIPKGAGFRYLHQNGAFVDFRLRDSLGAVPLTLGNKVIFALSGGVDVVYTIEKRKIKEEIILRTKPASNILSFSFSQNGLSPKAAGDGYHLFDDSGNELFYIPKPTVNDSQGAIGNATLEITNSAAILTVNRAFMNTAVYPMTIDPTVVATSTSSEATAYSIQRKMVKTSGGTLVLFYQSGMDIVYRTSTDKGVSWSSPSIAAPSNYAQFSVEVDATDNIYLAYYHNDANAYVFFKKLTYSGNNAWTPGSEYAVESAGSSQRYPSLTRENGGRIWISYLFYNGSTYYVYIKYSDNEGASWSAATNLATTNSYGSSQLVLYSSYPAAFYEVSDQYIKWRYWNGTSWSTEATVVGSTPVDYDDNNWGSVAVTDNNHIHLVYTKISGGFVRHTYYDGASWSSPTSLSEAAGDRYPSLTTDGNNLWAFWSQYLGENQYRIVYKKFNGASWDVSPTVLSNSSGRAFDKVWDYLNSVPWKQNTSYDTLFRFYNGSVYYGNQIGQNLAIHPLDNSNKKLSVKFVANSSKTVAQFRLRVSVTGSSPTYRFGIQGDRNGFPDGKWINGRTAYVDVSPAFFSSWITLDIPNSAINAGTTYHLVVQYQSGTIDASNYTSIYYVTPNVTSGEGVCTYNGTSWTGVGAEPVYVLDYSDSTYEGQSIWTNSVIDLVNSDFRAGEKFVPSSNFTPTSLALYGYRYGAPTGNLLVKIFDSGDNEVFSGTIATPSSPTSPTWLSTPISGLSLTAGSTYRIAAQASGVDSSNYYAINLGSCGSVSSPYADLSWGGTTNLYTYTNTWSGWSDKTTAASNTAGGDIPLFNSVNDNLYVGLSEKFNYTYFSLSTLASSTVSPTWQYWNGTAWQTLNLNENANYGFTANAGVAFNSPADWVQNSVNGSTQYWVKITRTAASVSTVPVASQVTPIGANKYATTLAKETAYVPAVWTEGLGAPYNVRFARLPGTDPLGVEGFYSYASRDLGNGLSANVNVFNGNLVVQKTDVSIPGRVLPDVITRTFNSKDNYNGPFGYGWNFSFNSRIYDDATGVWLTDGDGSEHYFRRNSDDTFVRPPGIYRTLSRNADGTYTVKTKDNTKHNFDTSGKLASIIDKNNNTLTYNYTDGKLTSIRDASNRTINLAYYPDGRLQSITDFAPRTTAYAYDAEGNLISETNPAGYQTTYSYDAKHNLSSITDPNGNKTSFTYGPSDRLSSIKDAENAQTSFSYSLGSTTVTDANNKLTIYDFNSSGIATKVTDPLTHVTTFQVDENHNRTSVTDARTNTTNFTYDSNGNLLSQTNPPQTEPTATINYAADALPQNSIPAWVKVAAGTHTEEINPAGNLHISISNLGSNLYYERSSLGLVNSIGTTVEAKVKLVSTKIDVATILDGTTSTTAEILPNEVRLLGASNVSFSMNTTDDYHTYRVTLKGNTANLYVDGVLKLTNTSPNPTAVDKIYFGAAAPDVSGTREAYFDYVKYWTTGVFEPLNTVTSFTYDSNNNLTSKTDVKGTTTYTYDANGNLTRETNPLGQNTAYTYDSYGQRTSVTDARGYTTTFGYDPSGNLTSITDPMYRSRSFTYDNRGNRLTETDKRQNPPTTYTYDVLDRLITITNPLGGTTTYVYDAVGNRIRTTDPRGNRTSFAYDAVNRLVAQHDTVGNTAFYGYDPVGNKTRETKTLNHLTVAGFESAETWTGGAPDTINYTEGSQGLVLSSGNGSYAEAERYMTSVDLSTYSHIDIWIYVDNASNFGNGEPVLIMGANSVWGFFYGIPIGSMVTGWNYLHIPKSAFTSVGGNWANIAYLSLLTWSAAGKAVNVTFDNWRAVNEANTSYAYDGDNRVTSLINPLNKTTYYTYDEVDNKTSETDARSNSTHYSYDSLNRLISVTDDLTHTTSYTYDALGNKTSETNARNYTTKYTYDPLSRLTSMTDALNNTTTYSYDAVGNMVSKIEPLNDQMTTYQYDALNQLTAEINDLDQVTSYSYDPDGNKTGAFYPAERSTPISNFEPAEAWVLRPISTGTISPDTVNYRNNPLTFANKIRGSLVENKNVLKKLQSSNPDPAIGDFVTEVEQSEYDGIEADDAFEAQQVSSPISSTRPSDQTITDQWHTINDIYSPGTWDTHNAAVYQRIPGTPTGYYLQKIEVYAKSAGGQERWGLWVGSPPGTIGTGWGPTYNLGNPNPPGAEGWLTLVDWGESPVWIPPNTDAFLAVQSYSHDSNTAGKWYMRGDPPDTSLRGQSHHLWNHTEEWTWAPGFQMSYKLTGPSSYYPFPQYVHYLAEWDVSESADIQKLAQKIIGYGTGMGNGVVVKIRDFVTGGGQWVTVGSNTAGSGDSDAAKTIYQEITQNISNYVSAGKVYVRISSMYPSSSPSATTNSTLSIDSVEEGKDFQGLKLSAGNGQMVIADRLVNLDLSTGFSDTDLIETWVYVDNINNVDGMFFMLETSPGNYFSSKNLKYYGYASTNGWNHVFIPKSFFTVVGTPSWSNITNFTVMLANTIDQGQANVTFDDWRIREGNTLTYTYDALNRLTRSKDALGNETGYGYDANGNQTTVTDPRGKVTTNTYDAANRLVSTNDPDPRLGTETAYTYDDMGNKLSMTDPAGRTEYEYDLAGQLTKVTDPLTKTVTYGYDEVGNQATVTTKDDLGNDVITTNIYDDLNRLERTTNPDTTYTQYGYDAVGNKTSEIDQPANHQTTYDYDELNRLTSTTRGGETVSYTYDANSNQRTQTDPNGTINYDYDSANRLVKITEPSAPPRVTEYILNQGNNKTRITDSNGTVTYSYNKGEQLTQITDPWGGNTTYSYDNNSQRLTLTNANQNYTTYEYDDAGRVTLVSNKTATHSPIAEYSYAYYPSGDIETSTQDGVTTRYEYNPARELTKTTVGSVETTYTYDSMGNRKTLTNASGTTNYTYNVSNQQLQSSSGPGGSTSYFYDASGNLDYKTDGSGTTDYAWNAKDELVLFTKPGQPTVSFTYNAQGRRASKTVGSTVTNYLYDGNKLIGEKDGSGSLVASYFYDDKGQLVSVNRAGSNYYYHYNAHGDVVRITDSTGSVVASYEYDAWGNITSSSGSFANSQPFRYAGYLYDSETGLYYLINRYYDPSIGRFISKDPRGTISPPDSIGANPYVYVRNNPVNATDPDGLGPTGEVWGRVVNTAGNPIVGATIRICNSAWGNYIQPDNGNIMPSNFNGEFHFTLIPDGTYTIYYDAVGYEPKVKSDIVVSGGGPVTASTVTLYGVGEQPSTGSGSTGGSGGGPVIEPDEPDPGPEIVAAPQQPLPPSPSAILSRYREKTFIFSVGYIRLAALAQFLLYGGGTRANLWVFGHDRLQQGVGYDVGAEVFTANRSFFMIRTTLPGVQIIGDGRRFEFTKWVSLIHGRPKYVKINLSAFYDGPEGRWFGIAESFRDMVITPL